MTACAGASQKPQAEASASSSVPPPASRGVLESAGVDKVKFDDGTKTINGFRVLQELGSGTFARVKLCEEESSTERFAMKVFRKGQLRRKRDFVGGGAGGGMKIKTAMDKVYAEVKVMKRIIHPNCIRLYAVFDEADDFGKMYLIIEYAGRGATMEWDGDRCSFFVPETQALVPEAQAKLFSCGVLQGLDYLHTSMIAHRDIKPQNLLVTDDGVAKIGDFGVAKEMGEDFMVCETEGTYFFYSPEMCRSGYRGHDARRADIWAFGVTLWAFFFGAMPFFHQDIVHLLDAIAQAQYELPDSAAVSDAGRGMLCRALTAEASERPLSQELLRDEWCRAAAELQSMPPRATAQVR